MKQSPSCKQWEKNVNCMLNIDRASFCSQHWRRCWTLSCDIF